MVIKAIWQIRERSVRRTESKWQVFMVQSSWKQVFVEIITLLKWWTEWSKLFARDWKIGTFMPKRHSVFDNLQTNSPKNIMSDPQNFCPIYKTICQSSCKIFKKFFNAPCFERHFIWLECRFYLSFLLWFLMLAFLMFLGKGSWNSCRPTKNVKTH